MANFNEIFSQVEDIMQVMMSSPEDDRVMVYRRIDPLFLQLEVALKRSPNPCAEERLLELKHHVVMMARLDDQDGLGDDAHCCCARQALKELQSPKCFG